MGSPSGTRAASPAPSQISESSALVYGSEFGTSSVTSGLSQRSGRVRPDLGVAPAHHRMIQVDAKRDRLAEPGLGGSDDQQAKMYIWGTRISVLEVQTIFGKFIEEFHAEGLEDDELMMQTSLSTTDRIAIDPSQPYYMQRLREISLSEHHIFNVNLQHLHQYNEALYKIIVAFPADVIPYMDMIINEIFVRTFNKQLPTQIEIRPFNAEHTKNMRDLNPADIDQLITTNGMVTRISGIIPELVVAHFECAICKTTVEHQADRGRIEEPVNCTHCNNTYCFQLIHNKSIFMDKQVIKLQEIPGDMPAGQTQHTLSLMVHSNLVEQVHPGDRVTVTGIYRANPLRVNPRQTSVKSIYRTSVDVLHFRRMSQHRLHEANGTYLTRERIEVIKEMSTKPDIFLRLARSIAPNIYGHEDVRKGLLCVLFGGTPKSDSEGNRAKLRSELNVLLCGDPGTAKSQLLQYVFRLVPRSQYTSGKGSSAVGLTASITHDPDTRGIVLQPGSLVMADNGICCIDEFDKMNDSTRSILHEVMEQQTLSIAKAGIICQLNARTSILAAANPVDSKWNTKKSIVDNVNLPHTLLSRFDLIFLILDCNDPEYDRRLAKHLVGFYLPTDIQEEEGQKLDTALLRDYIAYAKAHIQPKLSEEAIQRLIDHYVKMRQVGTKRGDGRITAYPRQLESLIRLSEAIAKIHLTETVTLAHVDEAYNLHQEALRSSATNEYGEVDVELLATGHSRSAKEDAAKVAEMILKELERLKKNVMVKKILFRELRPIDKDRVVTHQSFEDAVTLLRRDGKISESGDKIRVLAQKTAPVVD